MRTGSSTDRSVRSVAARLRPVSFVLRHGQGGRDKAGKTKDGQSGGFTLLELMVVLTLILTIISIATPMYERAILRAREAVLRDNLFTMRNLIDQFTLDKQRPPQSLEELVEAGYLRGGVPEDPITRSKDTWQVDFEDVVVGANQAMPGIVNVHSGSEEVSTDGTTPYSSW
jgi:general secretion pathway protein G